MLVLTMYKAIMHHKDHAILSTYISSLLLSIIDELIVFSDIFQCIQGIRGLSTGQGICGVLFDHFW